MRIYESSHARKEMQDGLGFWIPRRGFPDSSTGFLIFLLELGFRIPVVCGIPDSLSWIPDSKNPEICITQATFP